MDDHLVEMYPLAGGRLGGQWDAFCVCNWTHGENFEEIVWLGVKTHLYLAHDLHPDVPGFPDSVLFL